MLFPLPNIRKRSVRDPDGELAVVPRLLHGRAALRLVEQSIDLFDASVGVRYGDYDVRGLEAIMGDYRLGRCIEACLLTWYSFVQPGIEMLLSPGELEALSSRELLSPTLLRLALWDAANARGGFVVPSERPAFLAGLGREWGLEGRAERVDKLVSLDSEAEAVLERPAERPTADDVMSLYNRGAVKTLLAHSTVVQFSLGSLPGDVLRRAYFMAKRRGVLVDVASDGQGYMLTLYGPEQAFGTAEKYGSRLADVSISLLRSALATAPEGTISGTASLVLHDRAYRFHLTDEALQRLGYAPTQDMPTRGRIAEAGAAYSVGATISTPRDEEEPEPSFDSLIEAALYRSFKALERQGYTHGWTIQREPDPLLGSGGSVLIPDFAFLRGGTRVFMEVAGFWSPSYRERKVAKLRTLVGQGEVALLLAVPHDAAAVFAGVPFPTVVYKKEVRATDLLALLDVHFGGSQERQEAAQSSHAGLIARALHDSFVPEQEVASALQAYSRTELLASVQGLEQEGCRYVPGVGLLSAAAIASVLSALTSAVEAAQERRLPLDDAGALAAGVLKTPRVDIEALLQIAPNFTITRPSLFEAYLSLS